jgi:hypothetical protein
MRYLKCIFTTCFSFIVIVMLLRVGMHIWTMKLKQQYNHDLPIYIPKTNFYCQDIIKNNLIKKYLPAKDVNQFPCIVIDTTSALLLVYIVLILLQYVLTYLFLLRLAWCPMCCSRERNDEEVEEEA